MHQNTFQRRTLIKSGSALALSLAGFRARAQSWPDRLIRLIVPAPAGGGIDVAARALGERLSSALTQPVVIDNKPGAAGIIGAAELLKSAHDGTSFMMNLNSFASEIPHVIKMPFEPLTAFKPLAEIARFSLVLASNPQVPANDLAEFIAYVKANKGKVSFASYSAGTVSHTLGLELNRLAKLDMQHIPYKGSPPALVDLMSGQVQAMFDASSNVLPHAKAGKLKVFATTAPQRLATFPNVPTFAELGYKDLTEESWLALWTTPDVPAAVQEKMRDATLKVLQDPKLRELFTGTFGWTVGTNVTPSEMISGLRNASDRQVAMLKAIGFKPE